MREYHGCTVFSTLYKRQLRVNTLLDRRLVLGLLEILFLLGQLAVLTCHEVLGSLEVLGLLVVLGLL